MLNKTRFVYVEYVVKMTVIAVAGFSKWTPSGSSLEFPSDRPFYELFGRNLVLSAACVVCSPRLVTVEFADNKTGLGKVVYPVVDEAVHEARLYDEVDGAVRVLSHLSFAARVQEVEHHADRFATARVVAYQGSELIGINCVLREMIPDVGKCIHVL